MLIGKTTNQRLEEYNTNVLNSIKQIVPKKVFAWLPVYLEDGNEQRAWLQYVWRTTITYQPEAPRTYRYFLKESNAKQLIIEYFQSSLYSSHVKDTLKKIL